MKTAEHDYDPNRWLLLTMMRLDSVWVKFYALMLVQGFVFVRNVHPLYQSLRVEWAVKNYSEN